MDAFTGVACPRVFEDEMAPGWKQVTLFNPDFEKPAAISVELAGQQLSGALGLDPHAAYYFYDFWNDRFVGRLAGRARLRQTLDAGEARVLSVHRVEKNPQVLSTNRHVTQGAVDMTRWPRWNAGARRLTGASAVVGGEPYVMVMAGNGFTPVSAAASGAAIQIEPLSGYPDLVRVVLQAEGNRVVPWMMTWRIGGLRPSSGPFDQ